MPELIFVKLSRVTDAKGPIAALMVDREMLEFLAEVVEEKRQS